MRKCRVPPALLHLEDEKEGGKGKSVSSRRGKLSPGEEKEDYQKKKSRHRTGPFRGQVRKLKEKLRGQRAVSSRSWMTRNNVAGRGSR